MKRCYNCRIELKDEVNFCSCCGSTTFEQIDPAEINVFELPQEDDNLQKEKTKENTAYRALEIVGAGLCIAGLFLPFIRASFLGTVVERSFNDLAPGDFSVFIIIASIGLLGAVFAKHRLTLFAGIGYAALLYFDTKDYFDEINSNEFGSFVTKGIGFYCMILGIILMIVIGVVGDHAKHKQSKNN